MPGFGFGFGENEDEEETSSFGLNTLSEEAESLVRHEAEAAYKRYTADFIEILKMLKDCNGDFN
jgi:hypothetical protein